MPYGYDKTRTERRCKDCNKMLYVFEDGEFCIECSRKQPKKWSLRLQTGWMKKKYARTRNSTKKAISYASWSRKRISCVYVRKIPKPATVWRFSCGLRPWTENFQSYRNRIHRVLRMQAQQRWNRKVWRNPQLTIASWFLYYLTFLFFMPDKLETCPICHKQMLSHDIVLWSLTVGSTHFFLLANQRTYLHFIFLSWQASFWWFYCSSGLINF